MKTTLPSRRHHLLTAALAVVFLAASSPLHAATYTWLGGAAAGWGNTNNWTPTPPVFTNDTDIQFDTSAVTNTNTATIGNRIVRSINFGSNVATPMSISINDNNATNGRTLTMQADSGNASINIASGSAANITIGVVIGGGLGNLILGSDLDIAHNGIGSLIINRPIMGTNKITKSGPGQILLTSSNTYTGNTVINGGQLLLGLTGGLTFAIGGSGTNTALTGTGLATFNGRFAFDLSAASTSTNATWTIVANTLTNSYGTNFIVSGFNGSGGLWTNTTNGVNYVFAQSNGVLSVQSTGGPTPYAAWVSYWQGLYPGFTNTAPSDNPDGDPYDNNKEFAFDGNPAVGSPAFLQVSHAGTNAVFSWVQRNSGVTYAVQGTASLATGPWTNTTGLTITNTADQSGISQTNDYTRKAFEVPAASVNFTRIQATVAP